MADAVITAHTPDGHRHLLLVERKDGHGWAVPGGSIDPGESPVHASARELQEETGLQVEAGLWRETPPRFVPEPRASDEAWAVTAPARADLGQVQALPAVQGADDAAQARWVRADTYTDLVAALAHEHDGVVFPAHIQMLTEMLTPSVGDRRA
jgi:ADP-ribose pyrophosphatase YjhB (NUDIX family)